MQIRLGDDNSAESALSRFWCSPNREITVHLFRYPPGTFEFLEHAHGEFSFSITPDRQLAYQIAGDVEVVRPGEVLVIRPGEWHAGVYDANPAPLGLTISVTERTLLLLLGGIGTAVDPKSLEIRARRVSSDRLFSLAQEMAFEMQSRDRGYDVVMTSLVMQFFVYLLRYCADSPAAERPHEVPRQLPAWEIVKAVEYMNHENKRSFSLARLCSQIGTSQSRFVQLFRNSTNTTPLAFYNRLLANKAKRLLTGSELSVKEIAYTLEFQNESHFCTLFRAVTGVTPGRFRLGERGSQ